MTHKHDIEIISDGTPWNTHVYNKDGVEIGGVTKINIEIGVNCLSIAQIEFINVKCRILANWAEHPLKKWANKKTGKINA